MKTFKSRLRDKELLLGSWISLAHPAIAEIMARAGFDWLAVDLEHSVITVAQAEEIIRTIDLCGVTPLVRLTSNNEDLIKRVMDSGAHGVIVPMVKTRQDAEAAVQCVKYPPFGRRGVGLARAQQYGPGFEKYLKWQEENTIVIVQIEHIEAVRNLEEIFSVKGVDGFIVGPYDLSASMGMPGDFFDDAFLAAMDRIRTVFARFAIAGGVHVVEPDPCAVQAKIREGYTFIAYSVDIRMLDTVCRDGLEKLKGLGQ